MDMKRIFCLFLALCLLTGAFAQSVLTGRVVDENQQPLPYANIVLLSLPDSAFVTGSVMRQPAYPCFLHRLCYNL